MKIFSQSAVDGLGLAVLHRVLSYSTLIVTLVGGLLLIQFNERYNFKPAFVAGVIVVVSGLFVALLFVPAVIERMKQDKAMYLREAITHTFYAYIMMASFVPVIGSIIGRVLGSKKSAKPFPGNENGS